MFQEGTIFPGLKLYKRGELSDEVHRMMVANSRVPKYVVGDVEAIVVAVRAGAAALCDVVDRFGSTRSRPVSNACTTTAKPWSAATSRRFRTAATSPTG